MKKIIVTLAVLIMLTMTSCSAKPSEPIVPSESKNPTPPTSQSESSSENTVSEVETPSEETFSIKQEKVRQSAPIDSVVTTFKCVGGDGENFNFIMEVYNDSDFSYNEMDCDFKVYDTKGNVVDEFNYYIVCPTNEPQASFEVPISFPTKSNDTKYYFEVTVNKLLLSHGVWVER